MKVRIQRNWQVPAFDIYSGGTDEGLGKGVDVELTEAQAERVRKAYAEIAIVNKKLDELYHAARKALTGGRAPIMQSTNPDAGRE